MAFSALPPPFSLLLPGLVSFALTACCLPLYISWLRKKKLGQFLRSDGPQSHAQKAQTPTVGGAAFIVATTICAGFCLIRAGLASPQALGALAAGLACGLIGLVDDVAKFKQKANRGLSGKVRLLLEFGIGLALGALLLSLTGAGAARIPFLAEGAAWHVQGLPGFWLPSPLFLAFACFLIAATANAINLHDGMDGLAAGTSAQVFSAMALILALTGQLHLAIVAAAAAGGIAAFLLFNRYPAQIFMGDTGSLFIGGLMAALALAGRIEIWFVPLTLIYIVETLSVMIQVSVFKLTKDYKPEKPMPARSVIWLKLTKRLPGEGKRVFRMAPLHHHFEALALERNWAEWQVVVCFWLAQLVICAATLGTFLWR